MCLATTVQQQVSSHGKLSVRLVSWPFLLRCISSINTSASNSSCASPSSSASSSTKIHWLTPPRNNKS